MRRFNYIGAIWGWLSLLVGIIIFVIAGFEIIKLSSDLMRYDDDKSLIPAAMINCFGFILMIFGSILSLLLAFYVVMVLINPQEFKQVLKASWLNIKDAKYLILIVLGALIFIPMLIWWMSVSLTPWMILFLPGLILTTFRRNRR